MNSSERLSEALHDLRGEQSGIQPPAHIRAHVLGAMEARNFPLAATHRLWSFAFAACALLFLGLFSVSMLRFRPQGQQNNSAEEILPAGESTSVFIPLPSSAGLPPPEETCLLRVRLQRFELRQFGLELPDALSTQYTQVEFVVGEDGLARAVRFVQPSLSGSRR
jgi:hypothetical protein